MLLEAGTQATRRQMVVDDVSGGGADCRFSTVLYRRLPAPAATEHAHVQHSPEDRSGVVNSIARERVTNDASRV